MTAADAVEQVRIAAEREADAADREARFPAAALEAMRATGLLGMMVPKEHGGLGGSIGDLVEATVALGRTDMSVAMIFAMHGQQVAALAGYAEGDLRERALTGIAEGRCYVASVTTEIKGGGLLDSDSRTRLDDGVLRLDRSAPIVTGGAHADAFLVTMRSPGSTSPNEVDLVWVERDQVSVAPLGGWQPLGMRATESGPMRLTGEVPASQVVGGHGAFPGIAAAVFAPLAHLGWAAAWLGTAVGAYSRLLRHLRSAAGRKRFDPGSDLALVRLASVRSRLDVTNAVLRHTARAVESTEDPTELSTQLLVNTLKTHAARECFAAVDEMIEIVGLKHGYFADSELRLERSFRDLRSASLNYSDDRLRKTNGALALRDPAVRLA
ncbi:acyl-CoA dehydrogenase family protein [Amycolatopsis azurea]|uniref:acyl-CoA dehydrogenase family protein n=1 Tax=Amycolatopsis azurea TaxID=36819 RepID=UPI0037FA74E4